MKSTVTSSKSASPTNKKQTYGQRYEQALREAKKKCYIDLVGGKQLPQHCGAIMRFMTKALKTGIADAFLLNASDLDWEAVYFDPVAYKAGGLFKRLTYKEFGFLSPNNPDWIVFQTKFSMIHIINNIMS